MTAADRLGAIRAGDIFAAGRLDEAGAEAAVEVIQQAEAEGVETIRVLFPDQHGLLRGKTVTVAALQSVFTGGIGVPSSLLLKDTSHRTVFPIWTPDADPATAPFRGGSDAMLAPDPSTFRILPWSPHSAWLFCSASYRDWSPVPFDSRHVLASAEARLAERDMSMLVGLEVEFHLYRLTDAKRAHADAIMPNTAVETERLAAGYQYLTEAVYAEMEPALDLVRRNAEALGLPVRSVEVEMGPGQVEVTFAPASPLKQADNMVMFRTMVKQVCARAGLHATFMPKPRVPNAASTGWHVHQSLQDGEGRNLFTPGGDGAISDTASGWIAGLLAHAGESCLMTNPTLNGYKRFQPFQLAPNRVQWAEDNRGAMLRGLMRPGDPAARIENRAPEPSANPHYCIASQILGGLAGLDSGAKAPPPATDPYDTSAPPLPRSLLEAIEAFEGGSLYREALGDGFADYLGRLKRCEWDRYLATISEWEQQEYFNLF
ncbi:glutamine synthetase [Aquicoccus sp. SCR17]|nr:glutamine synthetase [Carideicomes alvinocaridis]